MEALPQAATLSVVVLGLMALIVTRIPSFRRDFRRSVSTIVGAVSLLTILLSLNVTLTALNLHESATSEQSSMINGLLLAGLVLMLVSAFAFFFSLGVLIWTLVPADPAPQGFALPDPTAPAPQPLEPYTP